MSALNNNSNENTGEMPCKLMRTDSLPQLPPEYLATTTQTTTQTTTSTGATEKEKTQSSSDERPRKKAYEGATISGMELKLRKEPGKGFPFIPLSIGRLLNDLWWEPISCEVPAYTKKPADYAVMGVRIFVPAGEFTMNCMEEKRMEFQFKISAYEAYHIAYLRDRMLKDIHSEVKTFTFVEWLGEMSKQFRDESESDILFAAKLLNIVLKSDLVRLPPNFHLFFQKKTITIFTDLKDFASVLNRNCIKCNAEKADFQYEIRAGIFEVDIEKRKK